MIWYLLNIVLVTIVYLLPTKQTEDDIGLDASKVTRKRVCIVGSLSWIILSGFRHISVGPDTEVYKNSFEKSEFREWRELFENVYNKYVLGEEIKDPGYRIFEKFVHTFTDSYQIFLIVIAVIFFVAMGIFVYKMSRDPYISYILFSCLFYSFFAITGTRQTIATALSVLIGTFLIRKKRIVLFLLVVLLASTIHFSCICFIPFYFISKIKINKATLLVYWGGIAMTFIFRSQFLSLLQSFVGYEDYAQTETASTGTFGVLLLLIAAIITIIHKRILEFNYEVATMSINAVMLACIFLPLLMINQSMMRVIQYFSLFLMIIIPELIHYFSKKSDRVLVRILCVGVLCFLLFKDPLYYIFFWQ